MLRPRPPPPPCRTTPGAAPEAKTTRVAAWVNAFNRNLPAQLLDQILDQLDEESLFALGRTCRSLNTSAFTFYLLKHDYYNFRDYLSAPVQPPSGLLEAIRCALFACPVTRFAYGFEPTGHLKGLIEQLCDLFAIVRRQPSTDCASLFFSPINHELKMTNGPSFANDFQFSQVQWQTLLCTLLATNINKGCKYLNVSSGERILTTPGVFSADPSTQPSALRNGHVIHPGPPALSKELDPPSTPTKGQDAEADMGNGGARSQISPSPTAQGKRKLHTGSSMRNFISNVTSHLKPSKSERFPHNTASPKVQPTKENPNSAAISPGAKETQPPLPPLNDATHCRPTPTALGKLNSSLKTFHLRSDMLVAPLFIDWTISLFQASSSTLSNLQIECSTTPAATWRVLFSSVELPLLRELTLITSPLLVDQMLDIDADDIAYFLSKHKRIGKVSMYGVKPGTPTSKALRDFHMPNLTSFTGHPTHVSWILDLVSPQSVPKLERVIVGTEYYTTYTPQPFPHGLLDDVLRGLVASPRQITFGFRFQIQKGMNKWIQKHMKPSNRHEGYNLIRGLTTIQILELEFSWYMVFTPDELDMIAMFIDAFPAVENVILDRFAISTKLAGWGLKDTARVQDFFGKRCPKLKSMTINKHSVVLLGGPYGQPGVLARLGASGSNRDADTQPSESMIISSQQRGPAGCERTPGSG